MMSAALRCLLCTLLLGTASASAGDQGTAFTYQGRITDGGGPIDGAVDMIFTMYDDAVAGVIVGGPLLFDGQAGNGATVAATDGLLTVALDFGVDLFDGTALWLEIQVRTHDATDTAPYETLGSRQPITPTPYALALRGLRTTESDNLTYPGSWNILGGHLLNSIAPSVAGSTIAGGGSSSFINTVNGDFGTVSGGLGNTASGFASAVGGGSSNTASGLTSFIGGGYNNLADDARSTVGGGDSNQALGISSAIGGGQSNIATADGSTIGGGGNNATGGVWSTVSGGSTNQATATGATVGGGQDNIAGGLNATVAGGIDNNSSGTTAFVGAGTLNQAIGLESAIVAGNSNTAIGTYSFIGGGLLNHAEYRGATIGGGAENQALDDFATIGGGLRNVADGVYTSVLGGESNIADGPHATVLGGKLNRASGSRSVAAGYRARANTDATFVWADSVDADFTSTDRDQFLVRATNGVGINTNLPLADLHVQPIDLGLDSTDVVNDALIVESGDTIAGLYSNGGGGFGSGLALGEIDGAGNLFDKWMLLRNTSAAGSWLNITHGGADYGVHANLLTIGTNGFAGFGLTPVFPIHLASGAHCTAGGTWTNASSRALKENFQIVNPQQVLQRVVDLPITRWNYRSEGETVEHIGPMAEDFARAFGLGETDEAIATVDADGVALASIQALHELIQDKDAAIDELRAENAALAARLERLETLVRDAFTGSKGN
jgi:hypothetical protein